jgi:hypothetical protein
VRRAQDEVRKGRGQPRAGPGRREAATAAEGTACAGGVSICCVVKLPEGPRRARTGEWRCWEQRPAGKPWGSALRGTNVGCATTAVAGARAQGGNKGVSSARRKQTIAARGWFDAFVLPGNTSAPTHAAAHIRHHTRRRQSTRSAATLPGRGRHRSPPGQAKKVLFCDSADAAAVRLAAPRWHTCACSLGVERALPIALRIAAPCVPGP